MARWNFDDCRTCRFRRRPDVCAECDFGEQFEDATIGELDFTERSAFARNKSLVTEDDEPDVNPDELIRREDAREENERDE